MIIIRNNSKADNNKLLQEVGKFLEKFDNIKPDIIFTFDYTYKSYPKDVTETITVFVNEDRPDITFDAR